MSQKIYIVEDDASIRELESYALKSAGFETLGFENSRDFFAQMESHLPDLILLDIMLPGTDGLKVLETIRSTPAYSKLPVILVTAKTGEIDAVKGLDSGADDYITKPFGVGKGAAAPHRPGKERGSELRHHSHRREPTHRAGRRQRSGADL